MAANVSVAQSAMLAWAIPWDLNTGIVDRLNIARKNMACVSAQKGYLNIHTIETKLQSHDEGWGL